MDEQYEPPDDHEGWEAPKPPKHKNQNHPRTLKNRTAPGDAKTKEEAQWGAHGIVHWNGCDVFWFNHYGGQAIPMPIKEIKPIKVRMATLSLVSLPSDPPRLGAAATFYSRKTTLPWMATWFITERTPKAARGIWRKFTEAAEAIGCEPDRTYMVMGLNGRLMIIADANDDRPSIPVGHPQEKLPKEVMYHWDKTRLDFTKDGRNVYDDKYPPPKAYPAFREALNQAEVASAIAYACGMYKFGTDRGLSLQRFR